jgi:hypothetical protein
LEVILSALSMRRTTAVIIHCGLPNRWAKKVITHPVNLQKIIPLGNMFVQ